MVIASARWDLSLPGCSSLKEKRSVLRSLRDRLRAKFNVSVAEVGYQDVHQRAEIAVAVVSSDGRVAEAVLEQADRLVAEHRGVVVGSVHRELH